MAKMEKVKMEVQIVHTGQPWYKSKKAWALITGLSGVAATSLGVAVPAWFFVLIVAYLGSQGVADIGKEKIPDMIKNALEDAIDKEVKD